eukprot:2539059-Pyramimonas_sp.AAC.1
MANRCGMISPLGLHLPRRRPSRGGRVDGLTLEDQEQVRALARQSGHGAVVRGGVVGRDRTELVGLAAAGRRAKSFPRSRRRVLERDCVLHLLGLRTVRVVARGGR